MPISQRNYKYYSYQQNGRLPVPAKKTRKNSPTKILLVTGFIAVSGIVLNGLFSSGDNQGHAAVKGVQDQKVEAVTPKEPPKKTVDTTGLDASIAQITKKYPYNTSVAIVELNTGKMVQTGDSYPFVAASTTKLLTAMVYLHDVEQGKARMDTKIAGVPASQHLQLMINKSDNPSWNHLNKYLGKVKIESYAATHGLVSYDADRNVVTSSDMAQLLAKFYGKQLLNEANTSMVLSWMQNTQEERFIPAAVPAGIKVFHKAGYLADRVHDVAIIDNGQTPFVIVIYSKDYGPTYNYATGQKLYKEITTLVVNTFNK
jgi:beta-lactamase class A